MDTVEAEYPHSRATSRMVITPFPAINGSSFVTRIGIAQLARQTIRTRASVVFELITKMVVVGWIALAFRVRVGGESVARQRFYRKSMCGVKIEILFEAIGVEKIIAYPSGGQHGKSCGIEFELYSFAGAEDGEFLVRRLKQGLYVAEARVGSCRVCVGTCRAQAPVGVDGVTGRMQPYFLRVAECGEFCLSQGNFGHAGIWQIGSLVDANPIPVDFQIGHNTDAARSRRYFPGEVSNHGARKARGKTHIFDHTNPLSVGVLSFYIRRDYFYASLIGRVHRSGGEVVRIAIEQKPQRLLGLPGT